MPIKNKVMLITYPDSLGKNLQELSEVLENDLKGIDYIKAVDLMIKENV